MKILIAGATGATGRLLVERLLNEGHEVTAVVRTPEKLPQVPDAGTRLKVVRGEIQHLSQKELGAYVEGCDGIVSCLGHNLNIKGLFGKPRRLVTDAARKLWGLAKAGPQGRPVKFILMNTTGNRNRDETERRTLGELITIGLIRIILPPHRDNEQAAEYLRIQQGETGREWIAIRPDTLVNEENVSEYEIYASPQRSPIFNPGKTSRINVADFMYRLLNDESLWSEWKFRMPVIYNSEL